MRDDYIDIDVLNSLNMLSKHRSKITKINATYNLMLKFHLSKW